MVCQLFLLQRKERDGEEEKEKGEINKNEWIESEINN